VWDKLRRQIATEREYLRRELADNALLIQRATIAAPDRAEITVLAVTLNSLYSGVENVFKRVVAASGETLPTGSAWHQHLLEKMALPGPQRPALISQALADTLKDYLKFRHFFRGAYAFQLQWENMVDLVSNCQNVFAQFEAELDLFLAATKDKQ
jgi:hypothetical protein